MKTFASCQSRACFWWGGGGAVALGPRYEGASFCTRISKPFTIPASLVPLSPSVVGSGWTQCVAPPGVLAWLACPSHGQGTEAWTAYPYLFKDGANPGKEPGQSPNTGSLIHSCSLNTSHLFSVRHEPLHKFIPGPYPAHPWSHVLPLRIVITAGSAVVVCQQGGSARQLEGPQTSGRAVFSERPSREQWLLVGHSVAI